MRLSLKLMYEALEHYARYLDSNGAHSSTPPLTSTAEFLRKSRDRGYSEVDVELVPGPTKRTTTDY